MKGSVCFVLKFAFPPFSPPPLWSTNFKPNQAQNLSYQNSVHEEGRSEMLTATSLTESKLTYNLMIFSSVPAVLGSSQVGIWMH